jgi:hypothetical protein
MQRFNNTVNQYLSFLDNKYVSSALSLFLVLYAGMAAPQLPENVARLFENQYFRLMIFFLIVYSAQKNPTIAIIAAVGLMVSLQTLSKYDMNRQMINIVETEETAMPMPAPDMSNYHMQMSNEIPQEALSELEEDVQSNCSMSQDFRDKFYPQYVESKGHHRARDEQAPVAGFDQAQNYATALES